MSTPLLSVIIPVFNEESTILEVIQAVKNVNINKEIIVVNDGSTDGTKEVLVNIKDITLIHHDQNLGKGAAVQSAIQHINGKYVIIQDGDMENNPEDYLQLLDTIQSKDCDVVFGSRWLFKVDQYSYLTLGNKLITWWSNLFNQQRVTDLAASYKLIPGNIFKELNITSNGFGLEAEITAKIDRFGYKIKEVPITYNRRSVKEGKKLRLKDGLVAAWSCFYYRFWE